jgi:NAD(P)-dependent dehydrogenase (short-subunit alcohol dehydrogenase family)
MVNLKQMSAFEDKTAIVTGATSGIGEAIASTLNQLGTNVILSGRDVNRGLQLEKQLGAPAHFMAGDIKQPEVNQDLVKSARKHFGRLDIMVLSAGQLGIGKLDKLSVEDWNDTITTNLSAVFYLLKYGIPLMLKTGGGSIVIIGSVAAQHAFPNHPAYTASKGALPALVKQIALDYSPEIRINLVSPAQVWTPLLENSVSAFEKPDEIIGETVNRLPMKRLGTPKDITQTVIHLLSDNASWITGSNFIVDGGFLSS